MDTRAALEALGVMPDSVSGEQRRALDSDGYFIVEDAFTELQRARMAEEVDRIAAEEGERAGTEVSREAGTLRISNVFNKSTAFDFLLQFPPLLAASAYLLGECKVHGANVREPLRGAGKQPLHSDSVKFSDGGWCLTNALVCIDEMSVGNGPTRIVPGSHLWPPLNVPGENAVDYAAKHRKNPPQWAQEGENVAEHVAALPVMEDTDRFPADPFAPYPGEMLVVAPARAIVVCNAHMWHSGTLKHNDARRRQLHLSFTRRDLPQQLVQRKYITPALYDRLHEAHRFLLDIV
ncbi:MAG: phytanoyl-CoA dioxygenase family protein [Bryobacteraceae bacterium]